MRGRWAAAGLCSALAACSGVQSALDPAGRDAAGVATLWWLMFGLGAAVFAVVTGLVLVAVLHRRRPPLGADPTAGDGRRARVVGGGVAATIAILAVVLVASFVAESAPGAATGRPLVLEVIGRQWWWEVHYVDPDPTLRVVSANEIHLPAGRPVELHLRTADVIHSFWVPSLAGKLDMVPGRTNVLRLVATEPGVYRGQCAEFCGLQHAHMALVTVVHAPEDFEAWLAAERRPAAEPASTSAREGRRILVEGPCALCHTVRGTDALATVGPDLTHLAGRRTLAAGTLSNNRGNLAAWIVDPQHLKPGARMPPTNLTGEQLRALLDYLSGLR